MAAVRAQTMQIITKARVCGDGIPSAATTRVPSAKGRAKIVCEKRINRRKRAVALGGVTWSGRCRCGTVMVGKDDHPRAPANVHSNWRAHGFAKLRLRLGEKSQTR